MDARILENVYQENLEERIIGGLAEVRGIPYEQALDVYYRSRLADKIHRGVGDVQYLDYKVLIQILQDTEPELFQ